MRANILHDSGSDRPALVYVPGVDGTGELMLGTSELLEEHFRLIRLCYEPSGQTIEGDGYAALAQSIIRCLDEAQVERPILLGESFGVAVALRTALDHPDRVCALGLINGFARYDRRFQAWFGSILSRFVPNFVFRLVRRTVLPLALFRPRRDAEAERGFVAMTHEGFDLGYQQRLWMISKVDLLDRLTSIAVPVAIFASDRDRIVRSVKAAEAMAAILPDATIEHLTGGGHIVLPLREEPWAERMQALAERARARSENAVSELG